MLEFVRLVIPPGLRSEATATLEAFRSDPGSDGIAVYLALEAQASAVAPDASRAARQLRRTLENRFPDAFAELMRSIGDPKVLASIMSTWWRNAREVLGANHFPDLGAWLVQVPQAPAPLPFDLQQAPPQTTRDWLELLADVARRYDERVSAKLGMKKSHALLRRATEACEREHGAQAVLGLRPYLP